MSGVQAAGPRLVEFPSDGASLRGYLYEHGSDDPRPTVVMSHGFSATISGMVADRYADVIHAAGLNVLLFDHKGFGLSGGEPRRLIDRFLQAVGYRDALDFAVSQPSVDADRLAIWGDSMSGNVAICVASFDERVRALVVQVPACGDDLPPTDPDGTGWRYLRDVYRASIPRPPAAESIGPRAVVSHDQLTSPSLLAPITAFRWFMDYGARPGTGWINQATLVVPDTPYPLQAGLCSAHLVGASLWVVASDDEMEGAKTDVAHAAFALAPEPRVMLAVDGGHFGLGYHPGELFDRVSAAQADFLVQHLR